MRLDARAKVSVLAAAVSVVALGATAVLRCRESRTVPAVVEPMVGGRASKAIPDAGTEASLRALRERIRALEGELAEAKAAAAARPIEIRRNDEPPPPAPSGGDSPFGGFRAGLERMKQNDSERYKELKGRFDRFRRMRQERSQSRLNLLASVDTTGMSAEDRENHERLQALVARQDELEARLHDESMPDKDRGAIYGEMLNNGAEMRERNTREREILMRQLAASLGCEGDEVEAVSGSVKAILDATDNGFGDHWRGGRRFGGDRGARHGGANGTR